MEIILKQSDVCIEVNDIFDELNEENKRLNNELMFANNCLNVLNKYKLFLDEICLKFTDNIEFEDKQKLNQLDEEFNTIITSTEQMNNSLVDFHKDSTDMTTEDMNEMVFNSEPTFEFDYLTNRLSTDVCPHMKSYTECMRCQSTGNHKKNESTNPLKSEESNQTFVNNYGLKADEVILLGNTFDFKKSHKIFNNSIHFNQRKKQYSQRKRIRCHYEGCHQRFLSFAAKKLHIKTIHTINPLKCPECDHRSVNSYALKKHQQLIHSRNGFQCKECHEVFNEESHLSQHMKTHPFSFVCRRRGCGQRFSSKALKKDHIQSIHAFDIPYDCTECDQRFSTPYKLKVHKEIHSGNAFECQECHKLFPKQSFLDRHIRTHSFIFDCPYEGCDKRYQNETYLKDHIRTKHTFEKAFRCRECNQRFLTKYKLKVHKKTHSNRETINENNSILTSDAIVSNIT